jgi:hypothetical protein
MWGSVSILLFSYHKIYFYHFIFYIYIFSGYEDEKLIGAPDEPPCKKQKTLPPDHHPQLYMQMV